MKSGCAEANVGTFLGLENINKYAQATAYLRLENTNKYAKAIAYLRLENINKDAQASACLRREDFSARQRRRDSRFVTTVRASRL